MFSIAWRKTSLIQLVRHFLTRHFKSQLKHKRAYIYSPGQKIIIKVLFFQHKNNNGWTTWGQASAALGHTRDRTHDSAQVDFGLQGPSVNDREGKLSAIQEVVENESMTRYGFTDLPSVKLKMSTVKRQRRESQVQASSHKLLRVTSQRTGSFARTISGRWVAFR